MTQLPIHDFRLKRRTVLGFMGGAALSPLAGCFRRPSASSASSARVPACTVRPQQTEGPFFIDAGLNRSDIRSDPQTGARQPGIPLQLVFRVSQVGASCSPLAGAIVDVWHCSALGVYSDVFDAAGQRFLRGSQVTNRDGTAEFTTIYPGWYPGRTVHIHFKIRSHTPPAARYEFTSQLYFDDAVSDRIYAQPPYRSRGPRTTRNPDDGIFGRGGEQLMLSLTPAGEGYTGRFDIGLELA